MPTQTGATPHIMPLGDRGLLVRFGDDLSEAANRAAIAFGRQAADAAIPGVEEVVCNLVSVLLRYLPDVIGFDRLAGEVRLLLSGPVPPVAPQRTHRIPIRFDGEDLPEICALVGLTTAAFVAAHGAVPLRVLATGFAPGFVYVGFHDAALQVPRRQTVRRSVPAGTVLFAAGQTAITSTAVPTGWHVVGHTAFRNFDVGRLPPTMLAAGDGISFEAIA